MAETPYILDLGTRWLWKNCFNLRLALSVEKCMVSKFAGGKDNTAGLVKYICPCWVQNPGVLYTYILIVLRYGLIFSTRDSYRIEIQRFFRYLTKLQVSLYKIHIKFIILREHLLRVLLNQSWDSSVGIATDYGLNDRGFGVRVLVGSRIFPSPHCPDRLWGPPNPLSNG
jgi:hypothetical protein